MTEKSSRKHIIVLGGSYAGVSISHYLLKHVIPAVPEPSAYHLTLVSTSAEFFSRPASVRAMISDKLLAADKVFFRIDDAFKAYSKDTFTFLQGTATQLDTAARTVAVTTAGGEKRTLVYYALVIATGARATSPLLSLRTDEMLVKNAWTVFREALPTAKKIVIAGGGPAGVEAAGELGEYLNGRAGVFSSKLESPKVAITVVTSDSKILPVLRPSIAAKAEKYLAQVGVPVVKNTRVVSVEPAGAGREEESTEDPLSKLCSKTTVTLSNGATLPADLYMPAMGVTPNTEFIPKDLLNARAYVLTNPKTLRVDDAGPRVYAIGGVGSYAPDSILQIYDAVPILATNIKRDLRYAATSQPAQKSSLSDSKNQNAVPGRDRLFEPNTKETQLVPIGRIKGVGSVYGWKLPSFFVWAIKGRNYFTGPNADCVSGKMWEKESKWKYET